MIKKLDLTKGSVVKCLLMVAVPILLASFFQLTYNLTDLFWLGRIGEIGINSEEAISGVGLAGHFMWFGAGLFLLAKIGMEVKIAHSSGENNDEKVARYARSGLLIAVVTALIYGLLGLLFSRNFIGLFGVNDGNVMNYAVTYMNYISIFMIFSFLNPVFSGIYNSLGKTVLSLLINSVGLILNIILDPIFILNFKMGVEGAAIASMLAQGVVTAIFIVMFLSKHRLVRLNFFSKIDFTAVKTIMKIGFPSVIASVSFTAIGLLLARIITSFGSEAMAAQRIGSQIESLAWMVGGGVQVAVAAYIGQNFGAKDYKRIFEGVRKSLFISFLYGLAISILLFVGAQFIMSSFIPDSIITIDIGTNYLKILALSQAFTLIEMTSTGIYNGLGKTVAPSIISTIINIARVPLAIIFSTIYGIDGIWYVITITALFKGLIVFGFLLFTLKKVKNYLIIDGISQ